MPSEPVSARDLEIGDLVRVLEEEWLVTNLTRYGKDEIEILLLKPDDTDQLVYTADPEDMVTRLS